MATNIVNQDKHATDWKDELIKPNACATKEDTSSSRHHHDHHHSNVRLKLKCKGDVRSPESAGISGHVEEEPDAAVDFTTSTGTGLKSVLGLRYDATAAASNKDTLNLFNFEDVCEDHKDNSKVKIQHSIECGQDVILSDSDYVDEPVEPYNRVRKESCSSSNASGSIFNYNRNRANHKAKCDIKDMEFVKPSSKLRSAVWKYFGFYKMNGDDEPKYDRTLCMICNNLLAYHSGNTSNMRQHLIRSHGIQSKILTGHIQHSVEERTIPISNIKRAKRSIDEGMRVRRVKQKIQQENLPTAALVDIDQSQCEFVQPPLYLKALVWKHFGFYRAKGSAITQYDRTWCKLCNQVMKYIDGSTSNMRSHLTRHHDIELNSISSVSTNLSVTNNYMKKGPSQTLSKDFEFVEPKTNLKALVWRYFGFYKHIGSDETKFDYTVCRLCNAMLRYSHCSTTNMRAHLRNYHGLHDQSGESENIANDRVKEGEPTEEAEPCITTLKDLKVGRNSKR